MKYHSFTEDMRTVVHVRKVHNTIREGGIRTAMRTVVHNVRKVHNTIREGGIRTAMCTEVHNVRQVHNRYNTRWWDTDSSVV